MTLAGAMIGHLVGDYVLQTDWMAQNKAKNTLICAIHVMIWTFSVMLFGQVLEVESGLARLCTYLWLFGTHFALDRWRLAAVSMNYTGQNHFKAGMAPWSTIAVDNTWHLVTIYAVWYFLDA